MSDTPRTDALLGEHSEFFGVQMVSAEHARQLERELNEAKTRIEVLEGALRVSVKRLDVIADEIHQHGNCSRRSVQVYGFATEARTALEKS